MPNPCTINSPYGRAKLVAYNFSTISHSRVHCEESLAAVVVNPIFFVLQRSSIIETFFPFRHNHCESLVSNPNLEPPLPLLSMDLTGVRRLMGLTGSEYGPKGTIYTMKETLSAESGLHICGAIPIPGPYRRYYRPVPTRLTT